jgi:hypothetical protein
MSLAGRNRSLVARPTPAVTQTRGVVRRGGCKGKREHMLTLVSVGGLPPAHDQLHLSRRIVIASGEEQQSIRGRGTGALLRGKKPLVRSNLQRCEASGRKKERKKGPTKENANERTNERDKLGGLGVGGIHA